MKLSRGRKRRGNAENRELLIDKRARSRSREVARFDGPKLAVSLLEESVVSGVSVQLEREREREREREGERERGGGAPSKPDPLGIARSCRAELDPDARN